jgi:beta-lactamase regulating signal transducer with metallopeptidase domain
VIACVFALLSLTLDSNDRANMAYRGKLLSFSRLGYILALLLLPLQLSCVAWLYGDTFNSNRAQRNSILSTSEALIAGTQQTTSKEQLVGFLRSRNINISLEAIAAAPLGEVKKQFISSVIVGRQQQEKALGTNYRSTIFRYAASSLRVFVALAVLAAFLRVLQAMVRRSSQQSPTANQPFEEALDQLPDPQPQQSELGFNSDSN